MFKNRINDIDTLKKEIDSFRPFSPHVLKSLKEFLRIGLTYTSNALEGNSLNETETKIVLEDGLTVGGKPLRDHLEAIGHSRAYDFMYELAQKKSIVLEDILELHRLFFLSIDEKNAGKFRDKAIIVTGVDYEFPKPKELSDLMNKFIDRLQQLAKGVYPIEYAARAHLELVTIHPFIDGNGRTARLLMNVVLLQHGYAVSLIPPVVRSQYLSTLRQSNKGQEQPFIDFISEMIYESHKDYLRLLRSLS